MSLKEALKSRVVPIILGASISSSVIAVKPVFVNTQDIQKSIVVEEDEKTKLSDLFETKEEVQELENGIDLIKYQIKVEETKQYDVNEDNLKILKTDDDSKAGLYSIVLIGSTIGLVGIKNKIKKKKMK